METGQLAATITVILLVCCIGSCLMAIRQAGIVHDHARRDFEQSLADLEKTPTPATTHPPIFCTGQTI